MKNDILENPPVCVERSAVGSTSQVAPHAETMGKVTDKEHFPIQERSLIERTLIITSKKFYKFIIKPLLFFVKRIKIER